MSMIASFSRAAASFDFESLSLRHKLIGLAVSRPSVEGCSDPLRRKVRRERPVAERAARYRGVAGLLGTGKHVVQPGGSAVASLSA